MHRYNKQGFGWEHYLGDTLRGNVPINQLIPQHPYLLDPLQLEEALHKNTEHIMLLTMDEARVIADTLYKHGTTYAGNIKDTATGVKNIFKLISYRDAETLVFRLQGLGIKAVTYMHNGTPYIKITGYPSVRQILNGTRYSVTHPKILELGIGKAGLKAGILSGARFCIYFSAAQRVTEFIFSSQYEVATFIGNITMDVAKAIVTVYLTQLALAMTTGLAAASSIVIPISVNICIIIALGIVITIGLIYFDKKYKLSESLINDIKKGMEEHKGILDWNLQHSNAHLSSMMDGRY